MNDDAKFIYLEITPATEGYAVAHGALFDKAIGWHYIGDVPLELEEFVIKPNRAREQIISVHCPVCGSQMKLKERKTGTVFWGCMAYPRCHGSRDASDVPVDGEGKSIAEFINEKLAKPILKNEPSPSGHQGQITSTMIAKMAIKNLGSLGVFDRWLTTPKLALSGKRPEEVMSTDEGRKKVYELLRDINK